MSLLPLCEKPLIFDSKENVSKVSANMLKNRKSEAVIFDNDKYIGIIFARTIVKRKINNPDKTEIKKFITKINPMSFENPLADVINTILINDYKSMPIKKGNEMFILTKIGILKSLKNSDAFRGKKLNDILKFPYYVSNDDSIATTMSVLRQTGVSRLPILNKNSGIEGIVDTIDLLKANILSTRAQKGELVGEKIRKRGTHISSLMNKNVPILKPKDSIENAIKQMINKKISTVLVEENKKIIGIITPKMILKLVGKELSGVLVTISGIKDEDHFIKSVVDEEIGNAIKKLHKIIGIEHFVVHVDKHHESGDRTKYSVKARVMTEKGMFFAGDFAWDVTKAIRGMLHKIEKEMIKKKRKNPLVGA